VSWRVPGKGLPCPQLIQFQLLANIKRWKHFTVLFFVIIVGRFHLDFEKPFKLDDLPRCTKCFVDGGYPYGGCGLLELGICHLRFDGPPPYEFVKALCVPVHTRIRDAPTRRSDCTV